MRSFLLSRVRSRAQIAFPFPYERLLVKLSSSWEVRRLSLTKVIKSREFDRGDSIHRLNLASLRSWQGQERLGNRERQQNAPRQRAPLLCAEETKVVAKRSIPVIFPALLALYGRMKQKLEILIGRIKPRLRACIVSNFNSSSKLS